MLNFFKNLKPKKLKNEQNKQLLTKTASLLIHAAKIDHEFTDKERKIIPNISDNPAIAWLNEPIFLRANSSVKTKS